MKIEHKNRRLQRTFSAVALAVGSAGVASGAFLAVNGDLMAIGIVPSVAVLTAGYVGLRAGNNPEVS